MEFSSRYVRPFFEHSTGCGVDANNAEKEYVSWVTDKAERVTRREILLDFKADRNASDNDTSQDQYNLKLER